MARNRRFKFHPGDPVKVKRLRKTGHVRTPQYVRGKRGVVTDAYGFFRNPESLAYAGDGLPEVALYCVSFDGRDVFAEDKSSSNDKLLVDIYEHWLKPDGGPR
jgi:nitrile hydratase